MGSQPVVAAQHVSFAYGIDPVLTDVSFEIGGGEFVALVGPNGSGKSTLLRILLGVLRPQRGGVALFGQNPRVLRDRFRVGYVPQRVAVPSDLPATVEEVVRSGRLARRGWWRPATATDRGAVDHALESVAMAHMRKQPLRECSGGQQQRVLIAKALVGDPELLVLDEPIAGVDVESQQLFRDSLVHLVEAHDATVLLVSHELGAVANDLDRVVVLKQSVVFDGKPQDLTARGVSLGVHRDDLPLWLEGLA
ncbi:MAG: ATPase component of Mn/Zn ABC-type transporter [Actinomycetia bacterium]|nr:ATPase component of Mn/Zn ABC-type transporter [Actinomycetes bacterium]